MVKVTLTIEDDNGKVITSQQFDATKPFQWKVQPNQPIEFTEPREGGTEIFWSVFGFTYTPMGPVRQIRRKQ